jgi:HTH-type transcriptional regulator/antitoxin HigA
MKAKILQSKADHSAALERVESLMDAPSGSPKEAELELWTLLIENYESKHAPIPPPDPIEAIRFRMDQLGLNASDLSAYIPSKSKISEVLNRKRPLSLNMIRALQSGLGISADILVQEPQATYHTKSGTKKSSK